MSYMLSWFEITLGILLAALIVLGLMLSKRHRLYRNRIDRSRADRFPPDGGGGAYPLFPWLFFGSSHGTAGDSRGTGPESSYHSGGQTTHSGSGGDPGRGGTGGGEGGGP